MEGHETWILAPVLHQIPTEPSRASVTASLNGDNNTLSTFQEYWEAKINHECENTLKRPSAVSAHRPTVRGLLLLTVRKGRPRVLAAAQGRGLWSWDAPKRNLVPLVANYMTLGR